jgi:hypothetical protein
MTIETAGLLFPVMHCDAPGCDAELSDANTESVQDLIALAKRSGWQAAPHPRLGRCPECAKFGLMHRNRFDHLVSTHEQRWRHREAKCI